MEFKDKLKEYNLGKAQINDLLLFLKKFLQNRDYSSFKALFNTYPHPSFNQIVDYEKDHTKKVVLATVEYAGVDDRLCEVICRLNRGDIEEIYKDTIPYLNLILKYEQDEKKHTHKGGIYYNIGLYFFKNGRIDEALLFNHRGLREDHMKHIGKENFPRVYSYQVITLDKTLNHPVINSTIDFISNQFLKTDYNFDDLYKNFLDKPSNVSKNEIEWLDHVAFFTRFMIRSSRFFKLPEDLLYSTHGELIVSGIIGELCLLIESVCKLKLKGTLIDKATFGNIYKKLKKTSHYSSWKGSFKNDDFKESKLKITLNQIFKDSYKGSTDSLENSFCLSYGLRNNVLHNINSLSILRENFKIIIQKQMDFFLDFIINF